MILIRFSVVVFLMALVTGCAVGNKYDYQQAEVSLPVVGSGEVGLGVIEKRSYVLSGQKLPEFIGLQRGGFGNPFDVTTASGKPLTDDIADVIDRSLSNSGYEVSRLYFSSPDSSVVASVVGNNGKQKNIVLTVSEWKTDVYMSIALSYDLLLQVINKQGAVIASATSSSVGKEKLTGAGFEGQNSRAATAAFETKIGRLFNDPAIIAALKD